ncbi:NLR family CARD domain-containing protein 3 [Sarotherodon galilaeus]
MELHITSITHFNGSAPQFSPSFQFSIITLVSDNCGDHDLLRCPPEKVEQRVRRRGCRLKRRCSHWGLWVILRDGVFAGAAGSRLLAGPAAEEEELRGRRWQEGLSGITREQLPAHGSAPRRHARMLLAV